MASVTYDFLTDRIKSLESKIQEIEAELAPLKSELAEARKALHAISGAFLSSETQAVVGDSDIAAQPEISTVAGLTMKQLTVRALRDHFVDGATAAQLLDYFASEWGRTDIMRSSFSPQLSRLKQDGVIYLNGRTWHLVKQAPKKNEPPIGGSESEEGEASSQNAQQQLEDLLGPSS